MVRVFQHFVEEPRVCSYLPQETASLEYRVMLGVSPEALEALLERGWRRFGAMYFRPSCRACQACVPLRIPVGALELTRSLRRVWKARERFQIRYGAPTVDEERLALYRRWHDQRSEVRGWGSQEMTAERYTHEFALPHGAARELSFVDAATGALAAVSLVDETPNALSAVYTFHEPGEKRLSLGTLSILTQHALGISLGKRHLYLGYRVLGCASSQYKARFLPHELLEGWPEPDEAPRWTVRSEPYVGAEADVG